MHVDQFNDEFAPFYAEFGYFGSVCLPAHLNPSDIATSMMAHPDAALAIAQEHTRIQRYFIRLVWRSLEVGKFDCSQTEYDRESVSQSVIAAAQAYQPPDLNPQQF